MEISKEMMLAIIAVIIIIVVVYYNSRSHENFGNLSGSGQGVPADYLHHLQTLGFTGAIGKKGSLFQKRRDLDAVFKGLDDTFLLHVNIDLEYVPALLYTCHKVCGKKPSSKIGQSDVYHVISELKRLNREKSLVSNGDRNCGITLLSKEDVEKDLNYVKSEENFLNALIALRAFNNSHFNINHKVSSNNMISEAQYNMQINDLKTDQSNQKNDVKVFDDYSTQETFKHLDDTLVPYANIDRGSVDKLLYACYTECHGMPHGDNLTLKNVQNIVDKLRRYNDVISLVATGDRNCRNTVSKSDVDQDLQHNVDLPKALEAVKGFMKSKLNV